jgi:hypothetical protein
MRQPFPLRTLMQVLLPSIFRRAYVAWPHHLAKADIAPANFLPETF